MVLVVLAAWSCGCLLYTSYLGARGVIECLCSPNYNLKRKNTPNIYFVGNGLSDRQLRETMELLEGVDFSVNVISKSGTTTEPALSLIHI